MNRLEFVNALGQALSALPPEEVKKALDYYVESIDDRMEDGMTEEEAIESLGPIPELAEKIIAEQTTAVSPAPPVEQEAAPETPMDAPPPPPQASRKKRLPAWAWVLLILGSPIWLSLGIACAAVALTVYIVVWAVLLCLVVIAAAAVLGGISGAPLSFFVTVIPDTVAMRLLVCGGCLLAAGIGFALLPASLYLIKGFCHAHAWFFQWATTRRRASK